MNSLIHSPAEKSDEKEEGIIEREGRRQERGRGGETEMREGGHTQSIKGHIGNHMRR